MRLHAAYVINSAFMIYDPEIAVSPLAVASNAVGEATNAAARLVAGARPSQILIGDFTRAGQPGETLSPKALIAQANELFREEGAGAASLSFSPDKLLRVTDKHKDPWYCYNLTGEVPNTVGDEKTRQPIGLKPDPTNEVTEIAFKEEPWSV